MERRSAFKLFGSIGALGIVNPSALLKRAEEDYKKALVQLDVASFQNISDEEFWWKIRDAYYVSATMINCNNGGVAPHPKVVQEAMEYYNRMCNEAPSYYMWRILDQGREPLRQRMAKMAGCLPEEIAFNRNSSEALETIIFGLRLQKGDEVVLTKQDYPNMIAAWKQREKRDGIVLKWINLELPTEDKEKLIKAYTSQFTTKTKIVQITHVINWVGQVIPAKEIASEAHARGIEVMVDAAHSFAHLPYIIPDLDCDYWGTSLHKWLSAPFGNGLLYVRKNKIKNLYPLLANADPESEDIKKFESLGTRSFAVEQAIGHSLDFFNMIGAERKFNRLCDLKERWVNQVKDHPKVKINTPISRQFSGAICNFSIEGKKPEEIDLYLFNEHKIHTVGINWENIHGVRVTPNVYTSMEEMDKLANAILQFANS